MESSLLIAVAVATKSLECILAGSAFWKSCMSLPRGVDHAGFMFLLHIFYYINILK